MAPSSDKFEQHAGKVIASLVVIGIGAAVTFAFHQNSFNTMTERRLIVIESAMENGREEEFNLTAASEHALREAIANPGHRVPDPRNPGQFFQVKEGTASP